uniref:Uncharacterized protein n=1 Tax=Ralstonia syzygii R24 TaxID=907261 RepID=G3A4Y9_9RALS|nr:hypothetical protein RALSY_30767 [Ralstonia syzygii R24]
MADSYVDRGCTVVKKRIRGASLDEDLRRIDSILSVLQDGQKLAVDANGRFDLRIQPVNAPTKKPSSQRSQNNERTQANPGTRATTVDSAVGARPDFTIDAESIGQNTSTFLKNAPTSLRIADWKNDRPKR